MRTFTDFYNSNKQSLDAVLLDVDGTLSANGKPLPGALELLRQFDQDDFPYLLLTNDSCHSHDEKLAILHRGGIDVHPSKILSAGDVLTYWASTGNYNGELFFQCGRLGTPSYAQQAGINITQDPNQIAQCKGVLAGEGTYDWQPAWEGVFNLFLKHPEYPFVVANPDSYWPHVNDDGMGVGSGGFARFICTLLNEAGKPVDPIYLGKPYAPIYQCVFRVLEEQFPTRPKPRPERIAMLGDSLASDIRGANRNSLLSCLVLTGITSRELADNAQDERKPAEIFDRI